MTSHSNHLALAARLLPFAAASLALPACQADAVLVLRLLDTADHIAYRVLDDSDCSETFGGNDARRLTRGGFNPRGNATEIPFGTPLALPVGGSVEGDVVRVELTVTKGNDTLAWCGCPTLPVGGAEMELPVVPEYGTPACRQVADTALPGPGDACTGACDAGICVCSNATCATRKCMAAGDACATCEYVVDGQCVATTAGGHGHQCTDDSYFCTLEQTCVALASFDYRLAVEAEPGAAFLRAPFGLQPAVRLEDENGALVELSAPVSLRVAVGTGNLLGNATAIPVSGVARFTDVGYDTVEDGVVLRAESGEVSVDLAPLDVHAPPGACQREDALFHTAAGGCQDQQSDLVWSSVQDPVEWYKAVWDAARGGPPRDQWDFGRTNDYDESGDPPCPGGCDNDVAAGCHSLAEAGQRDWRLATARDLVLLAEHLQMGSGGYLANEEADLMVHSSSSDGVRDTAVNLSTAMSDDVTKSALHSFVCVRGGRSPPAQLVALDAPRAVGVDALALNPLVVAVRDANGARIAAEGDTVVIQSVDIGAVTGVPSAPTDQSGVATLDAWRLSTPGAPVTLTIGMPAMPGAGTVTLQLVVGAFPHSCAIEDDVFVTAGGGCRQTSTELVWSGPSPSPMTWYDAVWDSESPTGNIPPDADDAGRLNDYDNPATTHPDQSTINYCHELIQGGEQDWRLPTRSELASTFGNGDGAATHFGFDPTGLFWSSTSSNVFAVVIDLLTGAATSPAKSQLHRVICVRDF